jgi:cell wall-associated NlpC family hydrolase
VLLAAVTGGCATAPPAPQQRAPEEAPAQPPVEMQAPAAPRDGASRFVDQALAMLGQPYLYGGATPGGFDCSGLVVYAAGLSGLALPRRAQELLSAGSAVPRDQLRSGDLVFMHLKAKELHVGIMLDDRRFIHAPSARGVVRIDTLDREPYARGFLTARRLSFPN